MNELELVRTQLRTERTRVADIASACAAPGASAALREAAVDYLVFVLTRFHERDQRLAEHYRAQSSAAGQLVSQGGTSREALEKLEAALADPGDTGKAQRWSALGQFLAGPWGERRATIDVLQQKSLRIADWRTVSCVDADSIVEERTRYARVEAQLPR